jgi:CheY-like chemotaxis protein
MRPRKRILLLDADDARRSVTMFLLENKGMRVLPAATIDQARGLLRAIPKFDALMLEQPQALMGMKTLTAAMMAGLGLALRDLVRMLLQQHAGARVLMLADTHSFELDGLADVTLLRGQVLAGDVVQAVQRCCALRRRGPLSPRAEAARVERLRLMPGPGPVAAAATG